MADGSKAIPKSHVPAFNEGAKSVGQEGIAAYLALAEENEGKSGLLPGVFDSLNGPVCCGG